MKIFRKNKYKPQVYKNIIKNSFWPFLGPGCAPGFFFYSPCVHTLLITRNGVVGPRYEDDLQ